MMIIVHFVALVRPG